MRKGRRGSKHNGSNGSKHKLNTKRKRNYLRPSWFCRSVLGDGRDSPCRTCAGDRCAGAIPHSSTNGPEAGEAQTPIRQPCAASSMKGFFTAVVVRRQLSVFAMVSEWKRGKGRESIDTHRRTKETRLRREERERETEREKGTHRGQ